MSCNPIHTPDKIFAISSSCRMHVMNHNWSATKQHLHPQSVAEISRHSVLLGDRIRQCGTSSGVLPQEHRSVPVSRHFLLQAPQCPRSVRKRFSRDHCCRGRSKPGCQIVGSHTRWELTTWADFQLCHHWLLMSTGCMFSHSGFLEVSRITGRCRRHRVVVEDRSVAPVWSSLQTE